MLRRLIGAAHVKDIESIVDISRKLRIERAALQFGATLAKTASIFPRCHGISRDAFLTVAVFAPFFPWQKVGFR